MLLWKTLCILAFNVVSLTNEVYGLDWPWNWKKDDVTCYPTCLAAVGTSAVVAAPLAIYAAGFGTAGIVAVYVIIEVSKAGGWFEFSQSVGDAIVGTKSKMATASTVTRTIPPLCAAICGIKEEDLKCYTHRIDGMKGLDENLIKIEKLNNIEECEGLCNYQKDCRAFRYLPKNSLCFVYNLKQHIEDEINESQFYVKRCVSCYLNTTKNTKERDDEIESVWEESSLKECENHCIRSDDCRAVHFDGERCFKFTNEVETYKKTGFLFFTKDLCSVYRLN